jgi:uncharacterized protein DUF4430
MKLGLCAGLIAGLICAAPAAASPATVTVRVEGAASTLVDTARVTTTAAPVSKAGHDCSGTSAGGALDRATAGNWDASYFDGVGHFVTTIMGEKPAGTAYWSLWINHKLSQLGACAAELQEGDDVLFVPTTCDDFQPPDICRDQVRPLALTAPATVVTNTSAQVTVVRYDENGATAPVEGASVGGAVTDAAGHATLSFPAGGKVVLKASKPGFARSESEVVDVVSSQVPGNIPFVDRTPPTASLTGLKDHVVLSRGPRELRGSFGADPSGIRTVKLRLTKRLGTRCWYFSGGKERFVGTRCGRGAYFSIGDRAGWSYLLPARLGRGRYVLDAIAIDGAGNRTPLARGTTRVVFTVR